MKSASTYVKTVKFDLGYGGCKAPSKPVPIWLPGAVAPTIPPTPSKARRSKKGAKA